MLYRNSPRLFIFLVMAVLCFPADAHSLKKAKKRDIPSGYQLGQPRQMVLPGELSDISGLSYNQPDNSVFAINDNNGLLYKISLANAGSIQKWKYHKKEDFEDIVLLQGVFYILNSNGDIYMVRFDRDNNPQERKFAFPYGAGNEFEIMYFDRSRNKLIIICKKCSSDKKKELSAYTFDPHSLQFGDDPFTINTKRIAKFLQDHKINFKPSAAAIHPVTGKLFIISSINKLLVVADQNGRAEQAYELSPDVFRQPEGLTFTSSGDMIISNEDGKGKEKGNANLLYFKWDGRR